MGTPAVFCAAQAAQARAALLHEPVGPTLLKLAAPNIVVMLAQAAANLSPVLIRLAIIVVAGHVVVVRMGGGLAGLLAVLVVALAAFAAIACVPWIRRVRAPASPGAPVMPPVLSAGEAR